MDFKVYKKELIKHEDNPIYVVDTPDVIDLYPVLDEDGVHLVNATVFTTERDLIEQACLLATIWQKGLDPVDKDIGVRWSESMLGEINIVQLMEDLREAVAQITPTVEVVFDTITDSSTGMKYLKYTLKAVA